MVTGVYFCSAHGLLSSLFHLRFSEVVFCLSFVTIIILLSPFSFLYRLSISLRLLSLDVSLCHLLSPKSKVYILRTSHSQPPPIYLRHPSSFSSTSSTQDIACNWVALFSCHGIARKSGSMGRSRTQGISLYPRLTSHTTVHGAIVPASVSNPLPPYLAPTIDPLLVLVPPPASPSPCFSCFRPRLGVWSLPPPLNPLFPINILLSPRFLAPLTILPHLLPLLISYHSASVVPVHTPSDPRPPFRFLRPPQVVRSRIQLYYTYLQ